MTALEKKKIYAVVHKVKILRDVPADTGAWVHPTDDTNIVQLDRFDAAHS